MVKAELMMTLLLIGLIKSNTKVILWNIKN